MAGAKREPNWQRIEAEYVGSEISYRDLASKHGVSASTLTRRAIAGTWKEKREQKCAEVAAKLPSAIASAVIDEAAEWVRDTLRMAREARAELWESRAGQQQKIVSTPDGPVYRELPFRNSPTDHRAFIAALDALDAMGRRAFKLDEPAPPVTHDGPGAGVVIVPADRDDWRDADGSPGNGG